MKRTEFSKFKTRLKKRAHLLWKQFHVSIHFEEGYVSLSRMGLSKALEFEPSDYPNKGGIRSFVIDSKTYSNRWNHYSHANAEEAEQEVNRLLQRQGQYAHWD